MLASPDSLAQLCIAVVPINSRCQGWLPCTQPRARGKQLCAAHYAAFAGVILGFQTQLKLPESPFVDPRIIKSLYAQTKKQKRRRIRRRIARKHNQRRQQRRARRDSRGTACCARTPNQHSPAIKHSCAPQPSAPGQSTIAIEEAHAQTFEAAVPARN
jgi:hypothetical protein